MSEKYETCFSIFQSECSIYFSDNIDVDPACIVILSKAKYLYIVILDSSLSFRMTHPLKKSHFGSIAILLRLFIRTLMGTTAHCLNKQG